MEGKIVKFNETEAMILKPGKDPVYVDNLSAEEFNAFMEVYKQRTGEYGFEILWNGKISYMYFC